MAMKRNTSLGAIFFACFLTVASPSTAQTNASPEAKALDVCKQGRAQYASGDVLKAVKTLGRCLEREPRNRDAWISLANANLEAGLFRAAVEAFAKAGSIKPGDEAFLENHLSALEGAGMSEERIPILRALANKRRADRKAAVNLLAAVEASGPEKHPDEYLAALQMLTETPGADEYQVEKLAAAYIKRGQMEKAEAEYRGLLVRDPESSDYWAGLGSTLAVSDGQAAAECYRKAVFYSNQADDRIAYQKEHLRLSSGGTARPRGVSPAVEDSKDVALLAAVASVSGSAKPAPAPKPVAEAKPKPKPFDAKAYQDSVYKVELAKRLAVLHADKPASASVPAASVPVAAAPAAANPVASAPVAVPGAPTAKESDNKAKESREREEKERLARDAKANQDAMARVEKARQDSTARIAEMKVKADKARQDSVAKVAEQKAKEDKIRQEAIAKAEKIRQDSLARVVEQKAKEDKARLEALAKAEKARQDSVARVAELKAKEEKARQEATAKADKARLDSLARIAEMKVKADKARQDSVARAAESKTKAEKVARERRERYDRAFGYYRDGKLDSSLLAFKPVLADSPSAEAWYYSGRVLLAKGAHAKALEHFEKAPQDKPDLDGLKGKAFMGLGKPKEALKAMESQYAKSGNDSLLEDLAFLKSKLGDESGAMVYLEKLAEKHPGMEKVQERLATYYRAKRDTLKATEKYSRVFIVNTANAEANFWLGMEAEKSGETARAIPFLEKAVTLTPNRAEAWKILAKADAALGRKDAAWDAYAKAFALSPADIGIARGKLALARESRPGDLAKCYEDVLRLAPADADAAMGLAKARYGEGDWPAAEKNFRIACKDSKDAHAWALFGRTLLELKKADEASLTLQKAIDLGDKDPALRLDLARIRLEKGDLDGAETLVKELSGKSPSDPEPIYFLGQIALKRQQSAVAEELFRKSHQLRPADGKYAEALARLYKDKEDWKAAVSVLAQAESGLAASGRLLYGDCLARGGDMAKAQTVYADLFKKEPSAPLLSRRMDLLVRMGKTDQAVELAGSAGGTGYNEATEVRFSLAKAQLSLADEHVLKGDVEMAVELMKQVLKTDDHRPEYHYYLGLGFLGQNKPKKALGEFVDALTYRVDYPDALYRKGLCLIRIEDVKDAENAFGELSQHADPVWKARGLYGLAMVFEAQGKPEAMQHHLERSVSAHPLPDALAMLSHVTLKQAKTSEAQEMARKALTLDPAHEGATVAMAEALSGAKKRSEAMELARQGLRAKPLSCRLLVQTAKLNFEAGKLDSTLAAGSTAIRICPEEPMGYYYAGVATQGSNRPKEAKQYFKSFKKYGGDRKLVPEN